MDWKAELAPFYDQAKRMLGVTVNPVETPADRALRTVADELGVGRTFRRTPVGVFFGGRAGAVPDPPSGCLEQRKESAHGHDSTLPTAVTVHIRINP
jgi:hypothetical protein